MKALEKHRQPQPIPTQPPFGNIKCQIIQFPIQKPEIKPELKVGRMGCCKTEMMDWDFTRGL